MDTRPSIEPGFMVLHGNRLEDLRRLTMEWLAQTPLHPMDNDVLLVQSNGIAQWLKMSMAAYPGDDLHGDGWGIAFGLEVMLPGRFQWQAYRQVLEAVDGPGSVPTTSPFDKSRLRWRLLELLPERTADPVFRPLRHFLGNDPDRRKHFQLAERLADLYDQYQVYRPYWLEAWTRGDDSIRDPRGTLHALPEEQRWQPRLWRELLQSMPEEQRVSHRAAVHRRFVDAARGLTPDDLPSGLPRRVVVFGVSALPQQIVHALSALSGAVQVMLCTVNPCRHYWGDVVEQRELLRTEYRRQRRKPGMPVAVEDSTLHLHAQPLLAAWGKQGRDYLHLLDEHDDPGTYEQRFRERHLRIDAFVPPPDDSLLGQLQSDIFELRPLGETRDTWPGVDPAADDSVVFHVCHGVQRELEVLHDQLLEAFSSDPTLRPRDIIVMVPDINRFAAHIHAVFGRYPSQDRRHVPYQVSDRRLRRHEPVFAAVEQLLNLPRLRFRASEVLELLDVPAIRRRFGFQDGDPALVQRWVRGANIRWSLHAAQRASLGLPEHDELHSWRFGLLRMLMGYAADDAPDLQGIWEGVVPYGEVAGLQASVAGHVYRLVETLDHHRQALLETRAPMDWATHLQSLLDDFLLPDTPREEQLLGQLRDGLEAWLEECEEAGFDQPLPLAVVRDSWLERLDEPHLSQRFLGGAVTFATLMPMRAIPFRQVCLLGMSDADYPRRVTQMDFDLMALPGQYAPGDRSRREDDRYLFLEALLSARERLYVSWSGRSPQDNSEHPPSVLVGQLRDHLACGWHLTGMQGEEAGAALLQALTTEHPLQPFSAAYFTEPVNNNATCPQRFGASRLITHAAEWEHLHREPATTAADDPPLPLWQPDAELALRTLADFLRDPVEQFFRQRLQVRFRDERTEEHDEEPFDFDGLSTWQRIDALLQPLGRRLATDPALDPAAMLEDAMELHRRAGDYPPPPFGRLVADELSGDIHAALQRYHGALRQFPEPVPRQPQVELREAVPGTAPDTGETHPVELVVADLIEDMRIAADGSSCRVVLTSSRLHRNRDYHWPMIIREWPSHLAMQLLFPGTPTRLFSPGGDLALPGLPAGTARQHLTDLMACWLEGMQDPLPTNVHLGMEFLRLAGDGDDVTAAIPDLRKAFDMRPERHRALARCFDTLEQAVGDPRFRYCNRRLYGPLRAMLPNPTGKS